MSGSVHSNRGQARTVPTGDAPLDVVEAALHRGDEPFRRGVVPERPADAPHVVQHTGERVGGAAEHLDLRAEVLPSRSDDVTLGDRAHSAQVLGDDEVGCGGPQHPWVELVDRQHLADQLRHAPVDVRRGADRLLARAAHDGQVRHLTRVVALVAPADQRVTVAERGNDLGRGR
ncbi:hypothetical protein [Nitriliruptor alkaliphilus]|uniref:hypothetical protein n=1 Tax=Nitriliruptor alkaliphilus TaxID=427918 RepID=UPI000696BBCE|nr:hypothetical protein [Nitriliruptor alkaliphilus]